MTTTPTSAGGSADDWVAGDDAREKEEDDSPPGSTPSAATMTTTPVFGATMDDDWAASRPVPDLLSSAVDNELADKEGVDVESLLEALVAAMEGVGGIVKSSDVDRERATTLKTRSVEGKRAPSPSSSSYLLRGSNTGKSKLTSVGPFWVEYDEAQGKWTAKKVEASRASSAALGYAEKGTDDEPVHDGSTSPPEDLLRDAARSRRKLQSMLSPADRTPHPKAVDDASAVDVDTGGDDGATTAAPGKDLGTHNEHCEALEEDVPHFGNVDRVRPGAFREGGNHGGAGESSDEERSVASAPVQARPGQPTEQMLFEANLVVEPQRVEAKPIRQRRQRLIVAGLVAVSCAVVALAVGLPLGLPEPPPKPPYSFVNISSLQGKFNQTLPTTTMDAVDYDLSSPPAMAYQWLFGDGATHIHPDLPKDEALDRLVHRFALATIYYATGGNSTWKTTTSWLDSQDHECLWYGVDCGNETSDAAAICKKLYGLPSVSCQLPSATNISGLDLSGNHLGGTIPEEMSLLASSHIEGVLLENNDLEAFPSALVDLTTLRILSLRNSWNSGTLPTSLGYLTKLEYLDVSEIYVSMTIPTEIASLTRLHELKLARGGFDGHLPSQLAALTNLVRLDLSSNTLSGPIPSEIGLNLTNLKVLSLASNYDITGTIPTTLASLASSLEILSFRECNFLTGSIPTELARLTKLKQLEISYSNVNGTIPTEMGGLIKLELLDFSSNLLTGSIPTEMGRLRNLVVWKTNPYSFSSDQHLQNLTGRIPTEIGNCVALEEFSSFWNSHTGRIPTEIGRLSRLSTLDVFGNSLFGHLPTEIGLLSRLSTLDVSSNSLSGPLPMELGSCVQLTSLSLDENQFNGTIPIELGRLEKLSELDLSGNEFTGRIPTEVGRLTNLESLSLEGNTLTGAVPTEVFNLVALNYLGLSDNQLDASRTLSELSRLSNLHYLYMRNVSVSGTIPTVLGRLTLMRTADLSASQLSGTIPTELGLLGLVSELVLSHNRLSGTIPTELAQLNSLGSLRLLSNNLTGSIPSELAAMSYLKKFRLEGNRLNGTVPSEMCAMIDTVCDEEEDDYKCRYPLNLTIDCALINCTCGSTNCTCVDPPSSSGPWVDDDDSSYY